MAIRLLRGILRWGRSLLPDLDAYLNHVTSVVHVGANDGRERDVYAAHGLSVVWIEPIPEVFARLQANLRDFPRQRAVSALVTDRDDAQYEFHVADNAGQASSIYDLAMHRDVWPDVGYTRTITLTSSTLTTIVRREAIDLSGSPALVLDTQGAELLVLRGADAVLDKFAFIKLEAADFELYAHACQIRDLEPLLHAHGFRERRREVFARHPGGGGCYDIVYERR